MASEALVGKQIWFIRHGQATHNVLLANKQTFQEGLGTRDPGLTRLGLEQARKCAVNPLLEATALGPPGSAMRAQLVVTSPLWRTLQTASELMSAAGALGFAGRSGLPRMMAHPDFQECSDMPCDTGRPKALLESEFPGIDFSLLASQPNDWFNKPGLDKQGGVAELLKRCARATSWLMARPEQKIVVISHHKLLCYLLQIDLANCEIVEMCPMNARSGGVYSATECWEVTATVDDVVPLYSQLNTPITEGGRPLSGSLETCYRKYGREAAEITALHNGISWSPQGITESGETCSVTCVETNCSVS